MKKFDVKDLWSLNILGINDPVPHKTLKQHKEAMCTNFFKPVSMNNEGRYKVQLPRSETRTPLVDNNKSVVIKRLQSTTKRKGVMSRSMLF